ncbi:MAG TPA: hypothetical protein VFV67_03625 [Actinophytocola sp.]|uniref:hypothetical protein n=1 Tax=Actinophytocola sp. TaxID=1872138 RepID=UPI002DB89F8C|nr:hypothetical protein [Actinophytocola sp.]HEU5469718.1 hypothetical protein [Actinophytocola sp.]
MDAGYRGIGFDPAPGDLGAVSAAVAQFRDAAEALSGIGPALRRAEEAAADWHGDAAEAFRTRLRDTPAGFDDRIRALRRAADVLDRWADVLMANRRRAEQLDVDAVRLRRRIELAGDQLADRRNAADLAATPAAAAAAQADLAAMSTLVAELEAALAEVLDRAHRLEREHRRAADAFADELAGGADEPARPARESFAGTVAGVLGRASRTSETLAGLLLPGGRPAGRVPSGAAAALAAAVTAGEQR